MSVLRIDITNAPSSLLLRMNSDVGALREQMTKIALPENVKEAAAEVAAEINRRLPIPGAQVDEVPSTWRAATGTEVVDATKAAVLVLAFEIGEQWRAQDGINGKLLDRLAELTSTDDSPKCAAQGKCACYDGCGSCEGCGRWLEDEMEPVRKRVRAALMTLLRSLDDTDCALVPENGFDREIDAIIHAARGL